MKSYKPFEKVDDPLLDSEVSATFPNLLAKLAEFKTELNIDSYTQMSSESIDREALKSVELKLEKELAIQFTSVQDVKRLPKRTLIAWLKAARLELLYHQTVGAPELTLSSLELKSFPKFKVYEPTPKIRLEALRLAYSELQLHPAEIDEIEQEAIHRKTGLDQKLKLVRFLKSHLDEASLQKTASDLLRKLWPEHLFFESELDLIATPSGFYFCFPGLSELKNLDSFNSRSEEEQEAVIDFIKLQKRFKFEQFEHFPMFSSFDARDSDPKLIDECCDLLPELDRHEVILLLNAVVTFEETTHIEKYLIHDTWGHIWQHDLTDLNYLYDVMANLNRPLSPFDHIKFEDNVISVADMFVIQTNGQLQIESSLKQRFIQGYLEQHISSIFAPIIAELTADIIEYYFWNDDSTHRELLPSSSLFKHNPTKLDFAWMDMNYFCKKIKSIHKKLLSSDGMKTAFIQMLHEALKLKFSRKFKTGVKDSFQMDLEQEVDLFLQDLHHAFETELEQRNTLHQDLNAFDRLLCNLLRIQFASNHIIEEHIFNDSKNLIELREIYNLFICIYFCENPQKHFWNLDETLVQSTLPFLNYLKSLEVQLKETSC